MSYNIDNVYELIELRNYLQHKGETFKKEEINNDINYKSLHKDISQILVDIDKVLKIICKHQYESDYIDITPDRGQYICYCSICHCTFS
jgi:hypothetical protein